MKRFCSSVFCAFCNSCSAFSTSIVARRPKRCSCCMPAKASCADETWRLPDTTATRAALRLLQAAVTSCSARRRTSSICAWSASFRSCACRIRERIDPT
jgi:hypothetical protein